MPGDDAGYKPSFRRTNWFEPMGRECRAVLDSCGIMDLSAFGKFELTGPDSEKLIDCVYANEVPKVSREHLTTLHPHLHICHEDLDLVSAW